MTRNVLPYIFRLNRSCQSRILLAYKFATRNGKFLFLKVEKTLQKFMGFP